MISLRLTKKYIESSILTFKSFKSLLFIKFNLNLKKILKIIKIVLEQVFYNVNKPQFSIRKQQIILNRLQIS